MKKIKIIAPSSYVPGLDLSGADKIVNFFKKLGCDIGFGKFSFNKHYFFAGNDSERLFDLENAFKDEKVDFIIALRGGAGSLHLLDKLDYKMISKHPKPFLGISDSTVLQNALFVKAGLPSFTGFCAREAMEKLPSLTQQTLLKCLKNEKQTFKVSFLSPGKFSGIMLGGNMRSFVSLLGTPYFPDMKDKILILEDVGEAPFRIDDMFMQLKLAGIFDKIKGLILGDFSKVGNSKDEKTLEKIIKEYFSDMPYPVARFKKYSHEKGHAVVPFGGTVHMNSKKGIIILDKLKKMN